MVGVFECYDLEYISRYLVFVVGDDCEMLLVVMPEVVPDRLVVDGLQLLDVLENLLLLSVRAGLYEVLDDLVGLV